jgi:hypothetical protein
MFPASDDRPAIVLVAFLYGEATPRVAARLAIAGNMLKPTGSFSQP